MVVVGGVLQFTTQCFCMATPMICDSHVHVRKSDIQTFRAAGDFDFGPNFLNSQREALEDLDWKCACTSHKKS